MLFAYLVMPHPIASILALTKVTRYIYGLYLFGIQWQGYISANIIGMFACYLIERFTRNDFIQRILLDEKQKILEEERNTLQEYNRRFNDELDIARSIQELINFKQSDDFDDDICVICLDVV